MSRLSALVLALLCCTHLAPPVEAGVVLYGSSYYSNSAFAVNSDGTTTVFNATIRQASGITLDTAGNVYVASQQDNIVQKFSATGNLIGTFANSQISTPVGLAFGPSGHLLVVNNGSGAVTEYSSTGTYLGTFATGLAAPMGVVVDPTGNVYVSQILNPQGNGKISKYSPTGTLLSTITANLSFPGQLAIDLAGNLYASNAGGDFITKYNSQGVYQGIFATGSGANNYGLAYDAASNSFFQATFGPTANPNGAIQRFNAAGQSIGYLALDQPTAYMLATRPLSAVPEPATLVSTLFAATLSLAAAARRRSKAD